jgi:GT2 family glycosyltransferase
MINQIVKDISIIIVNWNTKELLKNCIESILIDQDPVSIQIIVVDNASSDGSVEMIKEKFQNVDLLENKNNIGFACANNKAISIIRGKYVFLLNSDTVVKRGSLISAVAYLNEHMNVGCLAPILLNADGSIQHHCYIKEPSLISEVISCFDLQKKIPMFGSVPAGSEIVEVAHACGAALIIRKEVIEKIGLFDEKMIFSCEDADLCMRIRRSGWKIVHFPSAVITHYGGQSRKLLNDQGINAMYKSRYIFFNKYHNIFFVFCIAVIHVTSALWRILYTVIAYMIKRRSFLKKIEIIKYNFRIIRWHILPGNHYFNMKQVERGNK